MFFKLKRIAFVAGVRDYDHLRKLRLSGNDAREISRQLGLRGFHVVESFDDDWATMQTKLEDFLGRSNGQDIGLIYFAGHGIQTNGENYLFAKDGVYPPVEGNYKAIQFTDVFERLCEATDKSIAILDACRRAPVETPADPQPVAPVRRSRRRPPAAGDADARLAEAPVDPPVLVVPREKFLTVKDFGENDNRALIAYACGNEELSHEGPGPLSYYTGAIVDQIDVPGLTVQSLFDRVSTAVVKETRKVSGGEPQQPWNSSHRAGFALRPRSWLPIIALPLLAFGILFVATALSNVAPFHRMTFAGQSVFIGLAVAALLSFATWRWGGEDARAVLVGAMTLLMWGVLAFFYDPPSWICPTACGVSRVPLDELGAATVLTAAIVGLLFLEIVPIRKPWIFLPVLLVLAVGYAGKFIGSIANPFPGAGVIYLAEGYYTQGIWILPFSVGLGTCVTFMDYAKSNWKRRLLGVPERRDYIFRVAFFALLAGGLAAISGPPLPDFSQTATFADWLIVRIGEVPINIVPGVALAATFSFAMWHASKTGSYRTAGIAAVSGLGLWVLVLWLANGLIRGIPPDAMMPGEPTTGIAKTEPMQRLYVILTSALILGYGLLAFGSMMASRLWRVPVWLLGSVAIVLGLAPYAIVRIYFDAWFSSNLSWNVVLLYCPWLVAFASVVAYGLTVQKSRQYGDNIKKGE